MVDAETLAELQELRELLRAEQACDGWSSGNLDYKRHGLQRKIKAKVNEAISRGARRIVIEAGRKVGKTFELVTESCEEAQQFPGGRIVYGAPTLKHLEEFVHPEFRRVCEDAPPDCMPVWNGLKSHYTFPNGAWVHLFGAKDEYQAKNGRGPSAVRAKFDEAGFCDVLPTVLDDVFKPSLQLTRGILTLSSSPSDIPEHPFTAISEIEERDGNYIHASWLESPMLSDDDRAAEIAENARQAGMTVDEYVRSAKYRREYLGERVVDPALVGLPEWEELRRTNLIEVARPKLFRGQEGIDWGGVDPHFVVFGYWHGDRGLVIEDELVMRDGETILQVADRVREKERALWSVDTWDGTLAALDRSTLAKHFGERVPQWALDASARRRDGQPWLRSCDTDTQLAIEFRSHGLLAIPARKSGAGFGKQLRVDSLRVLMRKRQLWVHPRCAKLDRDLRATTWRNERREEWARRADGSHGDGCDALDYLHTNLDRELPLDAPPMQATPAGQVRERALLGDSPMARLLMSRRR